MLFRLFTIIAVAALAISTWIWSSPSHRPQSQTDLKLPLPGYYLKNAVLTDYGLDGDPSIRIEAERIDQIAHGSEVALYTVKVDYVTPSGQAWVMVGDVAHVQPGGNTVDVTGNVRLQGDATGRGQAVIRTDTLRYNIVDAVASTGSDVRIDFAGHMLTARGMVADLKGRTMHLESKVSGRFHP